MLGLKAQEWALGPQGVGAGTSRRRSGRWDLKAWVLVPQGAGVGAGTSRRGCSYLKAQEWVLEPHLKAWVLGPSMCKLVLYVQIVTLASTTFILTAMSVDRYLAI